MSESFRPAKLRACIHCRRVQYEKDFTSTGCANCGTRICTPNFVGLIAMMTPRSSWVARAQSIVSLKPGTYAVSVTVPENAEAAEDEELDAGLNGVNDEYEDDLAGLPDADREAETGGAGRSAIRYDDEDD